MSNHKGQSKVFNSDLKQLSGKPSKFYNYESVLKQTLDKQTLDTTNPRHDSIRDNKPFSWQTLVMFYVHCSVMFCAYHI